MRKCQTAAIHIFYFYLIIQKNLYFVRKHIWKNLIYAVTFVLQFFAQQVIGNAATKDQHPYRYVLILKMPYIDST